MVVKMSRMSPKITWYRKNWENINWHGKRQSIDTNKVTQMLELYDKDIRRSY